MKGSANLPAVVAGLPEEGARRRPAAAPAQRFWRRYFEFYDTLLESIPYRQMIERHAELLAPRPGERVLDAGTGTGNVALALLARGAQVVGVDFCADALEICRRKAPAAQFLPGDLTGNLELDDASFDKLACCNVIYTLSPAAQRNAVAELCRVLKPGGAAAITVFGAGFRALSVYREMVRLQRRATGFADTVRRCLRFSINTVRILYYVRRIKGQQKEGAYTFFTREQLTALLTEGGFVVAAIEPTFASQCLLALAHKPEA
jgi:ubiquinone/menaquinone biosynthesis C-methylase UbiE